MEKPFPWLKYVDAEDLTDARVDFDGLNVESPTGEHLGDVEGFIVDVTDARPYYVVVDSGGWFKSKEFLLPVGQARLDLTREVLVTSLDRDRIEAFPGFDLDEFGALSEEGLRAFNNRTSIAVTGGRESYAEAEPFTNAWQRPEFDYPEWWGETPARSADVKPSRVTPAAGDPSPHFDGRAQPGDVLGLETDGETTGIGDTADDENKRRQNAQEQVTRHR